MDTTLRRNRITESTPAGFTLVELLVVITIIGILAALITVAAVGALKKAQETRIKAEINEISNALDEYKNKTTAYPPNCQTDDTTIGGAEPATTPIDEAAVLNDLKRHLKQSFPRHQESDDLIARLAGLASGQQLKGGLTAGEAVVFWLGGFSSDPKYPLSGEGGPSYVIPSLGNTTNRTIDPIESRKWVFPFEVSRLAPRATDGYFDDSAAAGQRFIEFTDAKGAFRRINFWQYTPSRSEQPYLYFDTSRHPAYDTITGVQVSRFDPPAATRPTGFGPGGNGVLVRAFKKLNPSYSATSATPTAPITFINPDKFQVMHSGLDGVWDTDNFDAFKQMTAQFVVPPNDPTKYLLFPSGPFIGDTADTIVSFTTETKIEDAAK